MSALLQRMDFVKVTDLQMDPKQPRVDYGLESDKNRFRDSVKEIGIQCPLNVIETNDKTGRFTIIDGHRRYLTAKSLNIEKVPCVIFDKMHTSDLDRIRYEIQNNRRTWRPVERATSLEGIYRSGKYKTLADLAEAVHMPESAIGNYFLLKEQNLKYLALWSKYELSDSFQHQFVKLLPKLKRVDTIEVEEIISVILQKIKQNVITNSKDLRKLGSVFMRFSQNEVYIKIFIQKPTMDVRELAHITLINGFSLNIEAIADVVKEKLATGKQFAPNEIKSLDSLKNLLVDASL